MFDDVPTSRRNVFVVTFDIGRYFLLAGSPYLGYGCVVARLSRSQLNVIAPSYNLTRSPFENP